MKVRLTVSLLATCLLLAGLTGGCAPAGYNIDFSLDPHYAATLGDDRVFVHLVPVNPLNRGQWEMLSADEYWMYGTSPQPRQPLREKGTLIFELTAAQPNASVLASDPAWVGWREKGTAVLMIMNSLPLPEKDAGQAPPRLFIPAGSSPWSSKGVKVVIDAQGVRWSPPLEKD
jgi:hypothetical protein